MQLIKHRIGEGAQLRELNSIIDDEQTSIFISNAVIIIRIVTKIEHNLPDNTYIIVYRGNEYYRVPAEIISEKIFDIKLPLLKQVTVSESIFVSEEDKTLVILEDNFEEKADYSVQFPIYDNVGTILFDECEFARSSDDEYSKNAIFIPSEYYTGNAFYEDYPTIYLGTTSFFDWETNSGQTDIDDIQFYSEEPYLNFPLHIESEMGYDLFKEDLRTKLLESQAADVTVSDTVDLEKQMFEPYIIDGSPIRAEKIEFKLHFRDRSDSSGELTSGWTTSISKYWNSEASTDNSDSLLDMGFVDDDVWNERKKLKYSFLRLLYYDSNDITNQNLLGYSTIFYSTDVMFNTYNRNRLIDSSYTLSSTNSNCTRIDSTLTVEDRYNFTTSSEGFHMYLYPDILKDNVATIYMKAEFNHARFGKIIPMTMPLDSSGTPIKFSDSAFPKGYMYYNDNGESDTNMEQYISDLFIPVNVGFSPVLNRYVYYFPWATKNDDRKITLTLFEPRVNGYNS